MKTLFVCLANSKKYRERCIAGVEVKEISGSYKIVEKDGKPQWLRPVSGSQHGAVSSGLVEDINLMDVVEVDVEEFCPNGYQSENALFEKLSIKKLGNIRLSRENLDRLIDVNQSTLFGNRGKAVHEDVIDSIGHSLTLIKVYDFEIHKKESGGQLRMEFEFNYNSYNLPITDVDFIKEYSKDENLLSSAESVYLTISLGINHNG